MVSHRWFEKPLFLRHSLWILPVLVATCFFFGWLDELRDYYEAYPIVFLLMIYSAGRLVGIKIKTQDTAVL
jgi:hypothetical protein